MMKSRWFGKGYRYKDEFGKCQDVGVSPEG